MTGSQMLSSVPGMLDVVANLDKIHEPPHGCELKNDEERQYWTALMQGKPYKLWNGAALGIAFKALKLEFLIRQGRARLDEIIDQGANPFDSESVAFDWMTNITKAERSQLSMLRALGLTFSSLQTGRSSKPTEAANEMREAVNSMTRPDGLPGFMATH